MAVLAVGIDYFVDFKKLVDWYTSPFKFHHSHTTLIVFEVSLSASIRSRLCE